MPYLNCNRCGQSFYHGQRGRPPKSATCAVCKKDEILAWMKQQDQSPKDFVPQNKGIDKRADEEMDEEMITERQMKYLDSLVNKYRTESTDARNELGYNVNDEPGDDRYEYSPPRDQWILPNGKLTKNEASQLISKILELTGHDQTKGLNLYIQHIEVQSGAEPEDAGSNTTGATTDGPMEKQVREIAAEVVAGHTEQVDHNGMDEERVRVIVKEQLTEVSVVRHEIVMLDRVTQLPDLHHHMLPLVTKYVAAGVNVFLVGPAGSGKSTIAEQVAQALGLDFYSLSLGPTTPTSKFFGYMDASGRNIRTPYQESFEHGGVMLIDELDNGHPGLTAELNQSTAGNYCAFACGMTKKHNRFRCVATGNTFGTGPDRKFVGRNILDAATLDRFHRITIPIDEKLELGAALANSTEETEPATREWVKQVQLWRKRADMLSFDIIISPRASIEGALLLRQDVSVKDIAEYKVWAGVGKEIRQQIEQDSSSTVGHTNNNNNNPPKVRF